MRTFTERVKTIQQTDALLLAMHTRSHLSPIQEPVSTSRLQRTLRNQVIEPPKAANTEDVAVGEMARFGHDFSRIQVRPGDAEGLRLLAGSARIQRKCATCESGTSTCPNCASEEKSSQRRLIPVEEAESSERDIGNPVQASDAGSAGPTSLTKGGDGGGSRQATPMTGPDAGTCPTQTLAMSGARCGTEYGAVGKYCYSGADRWWFKESVTMGSPNTCVPGATINQTSAPFQASGHCVSDDIKNHNGPPSSVAPCKIVTNQTAFTGPTRATVEQCQYSNTQVIEVTGSRAAGGKVITSSAGVSTSCDWT
jgi:hypothetical protein